MASLDEKLSKLADAVTETQEMIGHVATHMVTKEGIGPVVTAVVELQEGMRRLAEGMVTRELFDEALMKEDQALVILQRLDQERAATIAWIQRLESDIKKLKQHLHLV